MECAKMFALNGQTNCATANRQKCLFLIFFNAPFKHVKSHYSHALGSVFFIFGDARKLHFSYQ